MADKIEITIDDKRLKQYFNQLEQKGKQPHELLKRLGAIIEDAVDENFDEEGRPQHWKLLDEKTKRQRAKLGYSGQILQRTGKLKRSITRKVAERYVLVGTNLEYAAIHNFGGPTGRNHSVDMPERPFMTITDQDMDDLVKTTVRYLDI